MRFSIHEWKIYLMIFKKLGAKKGYKYGKNVERPTKAKSSSKPCANLTASVATEVSDKTRYATLSASAPRPMLHSFGANAIGWMYS